MIRSVLIGAIHFYQRFISPHKGYCCAYAAYHAAPSCSEQVKFIIINRPVFQWPLLIHKQFRACRMAYFSITNKKEDEQKKKKQRENWLDCCDPGLACDLIPAPRHCGKLIHKLDLDIGCCPFDIF